MADVALWGIVRLWMTQPGEAQSDNLNVSDELWARIQPLLPVVQRRHRWPGRQRIDDRACLNGILFILVTGIGWQQLPQLLGYRSGMTCWRRLRDWQTAGVWDRLHEAAARRAPRHQPP
jgi:transposase